MRHSMCAAKQCQASYQAISVTKVTLGYYGWDRRCWSSLLSPKDSFPRFSYFIRKVKQRARKEAAEMFLESPFSQTAESRLDRNGSNLKLFHDAHELYLWVTGPECHLGKNVWWCMPRSFSSSIPLRHGLHERPFVAQPSKERWQ